MPRLGPKAFEQCAGFLRVRGGDDPLDASACTPSPTRWYGGSSPRPAGTCASLLGNGAGAAVAARRRDFVDDFFGLPTVTDILAELEKPGRDPRPEFRTATFTEGVEKVADLQPGMVLEGVVTNVAAFGAFVDVGVHQDGLVHVSAMSAGYVADPRDVVKSGDVVKVKVLSVDVPRNRIGLTLRLDEEADAGRATDRRPGGRRPGSAAPAAGAVAGRGRPGGAVVSVAVLPTASSGRRGRRRPAVAARRAALRPSRRRPVTAIVAADRVAPAPTAAAAPSTVGVAAGGRTGPRFGPTDGAPRTAPVPATDGGRGRAARFRRRGRSPASRTVAVPGTAAVGARATVVSPGTVAGPRTTVATAVPAATGAAGPSRPVPSPTPCAGRASPARTRRTRGTGVADEPSATRRSYAGRVTVARSLVLFAVAAVAEIGGAWLVWQGVREHRGVAWIGAGLIALGIYGFVATLQPDANFGRVLAAYGGIFVAGSLVWGVLVDGFRPDRYDIAGALICLLGVVVIMYAPHAG